MHSICNLKDICIQIESIPFYVSGSISDHCKAMAIEFTEISNLVVLQLIRKTNHLDKICQSLDWWLDRED